MFVFVYSGEKGHQKKAPKRVQVCVCKARNATSKKNLELCKQLRNVNIL